MGLKNFDLLSKIQIKKIHGNGNIVSYKIYRGLTTACTNKNWFVVLLSRVNFGD